jgi:putative transposase
VLPRTGRVKLRDDGARLAGRVAAGTARVLAVPARRERGRWCASFTAGQEAARPAASGPAAVAGVDLGIKTLATLATGAAIPDSRHPGKSLRKVRRLSRAASRRRGPDRRTGQRPSNRWRHASAAPAKAQGRVAGRRRDALHKATTGLTGRSGTIVAGDLMSAGCWRTGAWPGMWRMRRSVSSAVRPGTRPHGAAAVGGGGPVVPAGQDCFRVWRSESQAGAAGADVCVHVVRCGR